MQLNGRDSTGERVSLLNDDAGRAAAPLLHGNLTSRPKYSSAQSSSVSSSDEVLFSHQNSWIASNEPSSPLSPISHSYYTAATYSSPSLPHQSAPHYHFDYPRRSPPSSSAYQYPPPPASATVPRTAPYVYAQHPAYPSSTNSSPILPQHHYSQSFPPLPNHPSNAHRDGRDAGKGEGKRYPCRLAREFDCDKTFTTSGHASRHSKIHNAEKMVACSIVGCDRKFTRSDNMKQHMETHNKKKRSAENGGVRKPSSHSRSARNHSRESSYSSAGIDLHGLADAAVADGRHH